MMSGGAGMAQGGFVNEGAWSRVSYRVSNLLPNAVRSGVTPATGGPPYGAGGAPSLAATGVTASPVGMSTRQKAREVSPMATGATERVMTSSSR